MCQKRFENQPPFTIITSGIKSVEGDLDTSPTGQRCVRTVSQRVLNMWPKQSRNAHLAQAYRTATEGPTDRPSYRDAFLTDASKKVTIKYLDRRNPVRFQNILCKRVKRQFGKDRSLVNILFFASCLSCFRSTAEAAPFCYQHAGESKHFWYTYDCT